MQQVTIMDEWYINENLEFDPSWNLKLNEVFLSLDTFKETSPFQENLSEYPLIDNITPFCNVELQTYPVLRKDAATMTEKNNNFNIIPHNLNIKKLHKNI